MRDDDRLLDLPEAQFGTGVVGVCDICGTRQAVIVLSKERFKLCVIDFLNKTWAKSGKKPGVPVSLYRSERVWFDTDSDRSGRTQAVVLSPTRAVRHPAVLITPDVYGLTTTLLDAAIRFAREGFEVLLPDVVKSERIGVGHHVSMWSGAQFRGGVSVSSKRVEDFVRLYADALDFLRRRDLVDAGRSGVFGTSYGGSLALALAARESGLGAVALAYPMPVRPADLGKLVNAPLFLIAGVHDRAAAKARAQLEAVRAQVPVPFEFVGVPGVRHHFLSRDLGAYDLAKAEEAWARIVGFLKQRLMPPPPRPPPPPVARPLSSLSAPPPMSGSVSGPPAPGPVLASPTV
ncbi:MAG: dienelactone hydrolase family protein [Thermoplasmata archaeon]|jgi:dienelactone hydrolase